MINTEKHKPEAARLWLEEPEIRALAAKGQVGLELESLRVTGDGRLSQTDHPFSGYVHIDRDFGEAQVEINTPPADSTDMAQELLHEQLSLVHRKLKNRGELLWPFSNPPVIGEDSDIRIAEYTGDQRKKTVYRRYLAEKYGRRKMTFSGIHYNYSFSEELLDACFARSGWEEYGEYRDALYLRLAENVLAYSWVIVALLSASPLMDSSFIPGRKQGETVFTGYASLRCSEKGYWNLFTPILSYEDVNSYAESIAWYQEKGLLRHEGELYYPVRIKPAGSYSLKKLVKNGVDHIELRMIDLNPLSPDGILPEDLHFLRLFLIWLAGKERDPLGQAGQEQALKNQKEAALFDWEKASICMPDGRTVTLRNGLEEVLLEMEKAFPQADETERRTLRHQQEKIRNTAKRYASQVQELYGEDYLELGLKRAREIQETYHV